MGQTIGTETINRINFSAYAIQSIGDTIARLCLCNGCTNHRGIDLSTDCSRIAKWGAERIAPE
eukprot:COSAG02_NODE_9858_length_2090_cov_1.909091_3_plen_63_part_00